MRIFLLGYMGSGKSTLGKKLANKLSIPFVDLDAYIEKVQNKSISRIFAEDGEEYFRNSETEALKTLTQLYKSAVVSLGGGAPCFNNNMEFVNQHGVSIYLKVENKILYGRLKKGKNKRPLIANLKGKELLQFIIKALHEREPYYSQATITIEDNNANADVLLEAINELGK